jgi:hypothetical protein
VVAAAGTVPAELGFLLVPKRQRYGHHFHQFFNRGALNEAAAVALAI